ncbi:transcription factor [Fusarium albosuccineum]|uniref:Transcription factor n=1 Tax=Fusarium albosuccineum TaxID=1237068 RepID=A0A8H4PCF7_9HYPO|nr:transcription factor [Fusarium albosuccineum]
MTSKHPLRRSCAFCRARKIKCSNETICEACRKQGADCIYDFEPPRPKGRNPSIDGTKSNLLHVRSDLGLPESKRRRSCSASSGPSTPPSKAQEDFGSSGDNVESISKALENMFLQRFPQSSRPFTPNKHIEALANPTSQNSRYTGLLSLLAYDLVGLVIERFGSLGCYHNEQSSGQFFRSGMATDEAPAMFDTLASKSNPLADYGPRQRGQLIDVWYSAHPLSFLVSKTLLLREVRDGTCDEILLAVMLADASFVLGDEVTTARGHNLLRWAKAQLQTRPRHQNLADDDAIYSSVPTRVYKRVTTAQALVLLAWNALSSSEYRRAVCYIDLGSKVVAEIKVSMSRDASPPNSSRINGVDVLDVEREVVTFLWWTTFSLNLWASIQRGTLPESIPATFTLDSLPMTESSSVLIQLDLVSENLSTLQKQKSSMREMWPLAHISSTVAYLFLHTSDHVTRHGVSVCRETIKSFGSEANDNNKPDTKESVFSERKPDGISRQLLLAFHHTMAIQFLFPKNGDFRNQSETVSRFCSWTEGILKFLSSAPEQPHDPLAVTTSLRQSLPKAFCLVFDTCARAFNVIRANMGLNLGETCFHQGWDGRLFPLANSLYALSKDDRFIQGATLRGVRKHLKTCARAFGVPSGSLGLPQQDASRVRSISHSPQRTTQMQNYFATTPQAMGDASSPFSCIEDVSGVSSSMPSSSGSSASVSTQSFTPFDMNKWPLDGGFSQSMLSPPAVQHGMPEGAPMNMWYSQAPPMVDLESAGPVSIQLGQWVWPTTDSDDTAYLSFQALDMDES